MDQDTSVPIRTILITTLEATRIIILTGPLSIQAVKISATDFINQTNPIKILSPDRGIQAEDPTIEAEEEDPEEGCKMEEEEEQQTQEYTKLQIKINKILLLSLRR